MSENKIIDFQTAKNKASLENIKKENDKLLTRTALTCDYSQYLLMDYMCHFVEASKEIASTPELREKHKKLLRTRTK